jgi:hypothetical protein
MKNNYVIYSTVFCFIVVLVYIIITYLFSFYSIMKNDLPAVGESILFQFYEYQSQYKAQNGVYDLKVSEEYFRNFKYSEIAKIYLPGSKLAKKYCNTCLLKEGHFKVLAIEYFQTRDYFSVYTINNNKIFEHIENVVCEQCSWDKIEY